MSGAFAINTDKPIRSGRKKTLFKRIFRKQKKGKDKAVSSGLKTVDEALDEFEVKHFTNSILCSGKVGCNCNYSHDGDEFCSNKNEGQAEQEHQNQYHSDESVESRGSSFEDSECEHQIINHSLD